MELTRPRKLQKVSKFTRQLPKSHMHMNDNWKAVESPISRAAFRLLSKLHGSGFYEWACILRGGRVFRNTVALGPLLLLQATHIIINNSNRLTSLLS